MFRTVIIEDEIHQQETLSTMLGEGFPDLQLLGIASSIPEAKKLLATVSPDLVFLDVLLPPFTSFDLLSDMAEIPFEIIFTTSYEEYAVRAFRLSAVDYLLKPVTGNDLREAVAKFRARKSAKESTQNVRILLDNLQAATASHTKIALPTLSGYTFVRVDDIVRCESDNTYTTFFVAGMPKIIVSKTLKECEQMLTEYGFYRVHNSHLINMSYIAEYFRGEGGTVRMTDGTHIDVSRRRKDHFLQTLKRM